MKVLLERDQERIGRLRKLNKTLKGAAELAKSSAPEHYTKVLTKQRRVSAMLRKRGTERGSTNWRRANYVQKNSKNVGVSPGVDPSARRDRLAKLRKAVKNSRSDSNRDSGYVKRLSKISQGSNGRDGHRTVSYGARRVTPANQHPLRKLTSQQSSWTSGKPDKSTHYQSPFNKQVNTTKEYTIHSKDHAIGVGKHRVKWTGKMSRSGMHVVTNQHGKTFLWRHL